MYFSSELRRSCIRGAWKGVTLFLALFLLTSFYFQYDHLRAEAGDQDAGIISPFEMFFFLFTGHTVLLTIAFGYCEGAVTPFLCSSPFFLLFIIVIYLLLYAVAGAFISLFWHKHYRRKYRGK